MLVFSLDVAWLAYAILLEQPLYDKCSQQLTWLDPCLIIAKKILTLL